ncbi:MAG: GNAT family N-acetyltransferase [Planctomycetota bacterium]|nr:MAG: GNAT family N-acetyltransferase [Planctomycetota bacterium]
MDRETGLPIGPLVSASPATFPVARLLQGEHVHVVPLTAEHDEDLLEACTGEGAMASYRYLFDNMPEGLEDIVRWRESSDFDGTRVGFAILDNHSKRAVGTLFLMRIRAEMRSIEVGNIRFGPALKRTAGATEAMVLLMRHIFDDLNYRRFEWKCDALNAPSRKAAVRFGFQYEGISRRDLILNGRTRDTAWYSILDEEWPALGTAFETWLHPSNFDAAGQQRSALAVRA